MSRIPWHNESDCMRKKRQPDKDRKTTMRSSFVFEELEPRVLLSADLPVDVTPDYNPDAAEEEALQSRDLSVPEPGLHEELHCYG